MAKVVKLYEVNTMAKATTATAPEASEKQYLEGDARKALVDRLSRIEGHVGSIKRMVRDHRCADEILLQVTAVKAALNKFSASILDQELKACMNSCMTGDTDERLEKVTKVLSTLLKQS